MHRTETLQRKQLIDKTLLNNGNRSLFISEIRDKILKYFGEDLSYEQIHYILSHEDFCDDYIRDIGHPDRYQLEPTFYLTLTHPK